jgi:GNAT superfamily N-acetyltransferase
MSFEVRRVRPGEGHLLRELRLRALGDAPTAFTASLLVESARPAAFWEEVAEARSSGDESAAFVALQDGQGVGLAGGFRSDPTTGTVQLVSMWVSPSSRGSGVGQRLVQTVLDWARRIGASVVELWVTRGNVPARSLYEDAGFVATGAVQPFPDRPGLDLEQMECSLAEVDGG